MAVTLRQLLDGGRVHVLDGAMGTMLYGKGFLLNVCYDELNLKQPKLIQEVHEAYVRAGAELIETNTFGANPKKLASYGLADDTEKINTAAARLARAAAGDRVSVLGALGPLGVRIEPFGPTSREEAFRFFRRQVDGLLTGGVDGFILETFSDLDEIHAALRAVRSACHLPDDDRHGWTHALRHGPRDVRQAACRVGRRRDRRELLGRPRGGARSGRKDRQGDRPAHLGRPERRPPQGRGRPPDLPRLPRVHGELCPAHDRGGGAPRGPVLRLQARAEP